MCTPPLFLNYKNNVLLYNHVGGNVKDASLPEVKVCRITIGELMNQSFKCSSAT
ncbi:putative transposable element encoded protein [Trachipleistophora hominis]|uniref:Putative transposable element encoded protein n=1 Tax=Trachipleistophora hominis TaxID=72359 RepID=L7JTN2_TRAHO|nr:putative transposable element encoded protein [Trachipleistophora hominis]